MKDRWKVGFAVGTLGQAQVVEGHPVQGGMPPCGLWLASPHLRTPSDLPEILAALLVKPLSAV